MCEREILFFPIYRDDPVYIYIWHFWSTILTKKRRKSEHCNSVIHCNSQYGHSYSGSNSLYYNLISSWRISFRSAWMNWNCCTTDVPNDHAHYGAVVCHSCRLFFRNICVLTWPFYIGRIRWFLALRIRILPVTTDLYKKKSSWTEYKPESA